MDILPQNRNPRAMKGIHAEGEGRRQSLPEKISTVLLGLPVL